MRTFHRALYGILLILSILSLLGCAGSQTAPSTTSVANNAPLCVIEQEPDSTLLGRHSCMVSGTSPSGKAFSTPIIYELNSVPGGYTFFFETRKPANEGGGMKGYQAAKLKGARIEFRGKTGSSMIISTDGQNPYFHWGGKRYEMQ